MALFRLGVPRHRLRIDKAARRLAVLEDGADPDLAAEALAGAELAGLIGSDGLGTIGGGNHFCEVQAVEEVADVIGAPGLKAGDLCLLVHSGSRGRGAGIFEGLDDGWKQGFDPAGPAAGRYLALHDAANTWARINRALIAVAAADALLAKAELICDTVHNHVVPSGQSGFTARARPVRTRVSCRWPDHARRRVSCCERRSSVPEALDFVSHGAGRRYDRASMHGRICKTRSHLAALTRNRFGGRVICADRDPSGRGRPRLQEPRKRRRDLAAFGLASPVARLVPLITFKTAGGAR